MSLAVRKCLEAAEAGKAPPIPFDEMFRMLAFTTKGDANHKVAILRAECMNSARKQFFGLPGSAVTDVFRIEKGTSARSAKEITPEGKLTLFVPFPFPDSFDNARKLGGGEHALLERIDTSPSELVGLMAGSEWSGYFSRCSDLGNTADADAKWVWLTRCVAPRQYVMLPFTSSDNVRWAQDLGKGGHRTAQFEAIVGDEYISPDDKASSNVNKSFWALLLGKIPEFDTLVISSMIEAPAPRELSVSDAMDEAVTILTKFKPLIGGGFTNETRDEPVKDTPSLAAEVAGAVAIAAGVALATGVVAALV